MTEKELYEIPLHGWRDAGPTSIQRVVGGWLYYHPNGNTFVPEPPQSIVNVLEEIIDGSNSERLFINIRNQ